jgi:transposase
MLSKQIINIVIRMIQTRKFTYREIEKITSVSKSTIGNWKKQIPTGYVSKKHKNTNEIIEIIKFIYSTNNFFTLFEIQKYLKENRNIICSVELIRVLILKNVKLSYKKCKYANFKDENKLKQQKYEHHMRMTNLLKTKRLIASIDEIGFNTRMQPIYGWSKKGERKYIKYKLDSSINKSACSCITSKGQIYYNIIDKAYKTNTFFDFFKSLKLPKGTIILIDNAVIHKNKMISNYAKDKCWELLFIPPYSPCFNPIENVFSVIKHKYRKCKDIKMSFKEATKSVIINCINRCIKKTTNLDEIYNNS